MSQLGVEFRRSFAFDSFALSEYLGSALDFGGSDRGPFQLTEEHEQLSQLVLDQFVVDHGFLPNSVFESLRLSFSVRFSGDVHVSSHRQTS